MGYTYDAQGRLKDDDDLERLRQMGWSAHDDLAVPSPTRLADGQAVTPDQKGPKYEYTPSGKLRSRLWARGDPDVLRIRWRQPARQRSL